MDKGVGMSVRIGLAEREGVERMGCMGREQAVSCNNILSQGMA